MSALLLLLSTRALAGDVLLVGASYVTRNDLEGVLEALLNAGSGADRTVDMRAAGGYTWSRHQIDASAEGDARTTLVDTPWSAALLQEFTDVAVKDPAGADWSASLEAGSWLVGALEANGADAFLYMTWGDRTGDANHADYLAMQAALEDAYARYRDAMRADGLTPYVAPVGVAWRLAYEAEADPLATNALFYRLYASDGQHPSALGTYLTACTMYATLTGLSPVGLPVAEGVPPSLASTLQGFADAAVLGAEGAAWDYPWQASGGGDTGGEDTDAGGDDSGGDDSGGEDTGRDDTGSPADTAGDDDGADEVPSDEAAGCGCASPGASTRGAVALAVAAALVARRRSLGASPR